MVKLITCTEMLHSKMHFKCEKASFSRLLPVSNSNKVIHLKWFGSVFLHVFAVLISNFKHKFEAKGFYITCTKKRNYSTDKKAPLKIKPILPSMRILQWKLLIFIYHREFEISGSVFSLSQSRVNKAEGSCLEGLYAVASEAQKGHSNNRQIQSCPSFPQIVSVWTILNSLNKFLGFKETLEMTHLPESSNQKNQGLRKSPPEDPLVCAFTSCSETLFTEPLIILFFADLFHLV